MHARNLNTCHHYVNYLFLTNNYTGVDTKQKGGYLKSFKERKLDNYKGRRLGGLASLGHLGAQSFERSFEANFFHMAMKSLKKISARSTDKK